MGYIYVLQNSSFPGYIKIGHTTRTVRERVSELNTTGVPTPFNVLHSWEVVNSYDVEQSLHNKYAEYRVSGNREFFQVECLGFVVAQMLKIVEKEPQAQINEIVEEDELSEELEIALYHRALRYVNKMRYNKHFLDRINSKANNFNPYYSMYTELTDYWWDRMENYEMAESNARAILSRYILSFYIGLKDMSSELKNITFSDKTKLKADVFFKKDDDFYLKFDDWGEEVTHLKVCEIPLNEIPSDREDLSFLLMDITASLIGDLASNKITKETAHKTHKSITSGDIIKIGGKYFSSSSHTPVGDKYVPFGWTSIKDPVLNKKTGSHSDNKNPIYNKSSSETGQPEVKSQEESK